MSTAVTPWLPASIHEPTVSSRRPGFAMVSTSEHVSSQLVHSHDSMQAPNVGEESHEEPRTVYVISVSRTPTGEARVWTRRDDCNRSNNGFTPYAHHVYAPMTSARGRHTPSSPSEVRVRTRRPGQRTPHDSHTSTSGTTYTLAGLLAFAAFLVVFAALHIVNPTFLLQVHVAIPLVVSSGAIVVLYALRHGLGTIQEQPSSRARGTALPEVNTSRFVEPARKRL